MVHQGRGEWQGRTPSINRKCLRTKSNGLRESQKTKAKMIEKNGERFERRNKERCGRPASMDRRLREQKQVKKVGS